MAIKPLIDEYALLWHRQIEADKQTNIIRLQHQTYRRRLGTTNKNITCDEMISGRRMSSHTSHEKNKNWLL